MIVLRITAISGGEAGLNYLLSGSGCAGEHQAEPELGLDGPEGYYAKGTERGTPLAVWIGEGLSEWGLAAGADATERDIRAVFGKHAHPEEYRAAVSAAKSYIDENGITGTAAEKVMADAEASARRGRKPYEFRTIEQRVEDRLAKEPNADPERVAEIRREERDKGQRSPAMYFDHTYSAQKSVSTYLTALEAAGRHEDAAKVRAAMNEGIQAAMKTFQEEAGFGRIGYHGNAKATARRPAATSTPPASPPRSSPMRSRVRRPAAPRPCGGSQQNQGLRRGRERALRHPRFACREQGPRGRGRRLRADDGAGRRAGSPRRVRNAPGRHGP